MIRNRKVRDNEANNTGADRYLITYADLITLLLGLFVILYASSRLDTDKFKEYSAAFSEYFSSSQGAMDGSDGMLEGRRGNVPAPILTHSRGRSINEISDETEKALRKYIDDGTIEIRRSGSELTIVFPEKLLFESARSKVKSGAQPVIDTLAKVLSGIKQDITIDGHTDSDPISSFSHETNWHLSVDRALHVADLLIRKGMPEDNLMIRGFGSKRPVASNLSEEGKSKNRRVEITIIEKSDSSPSADGYIEKDDSTKI